MVLMMLNFKYLLLFIFFGASSSFAALDVGIGYSSFTSGQTVPSILVQGNMGKNAIDFTTVGYASEYDYLSGYSSSYYSVDTAGRYLSLNVDYGLGGGFYFSERGYQEAPSSEVEKSQDVGIGPAFFLRLNVGDNLFVRIQSLLGVGHGNNVALIFQDVSHFSLGFRW